jgi:hypothetical protein
MTIKTFASGEVLTAANTNTYLASAGLVYVKQQTVGSGVGSVTVTGAFNTNFDNYKVFYTAGTGTNNATLAWTFVGTLGASTYYGNLFYANFTSGAAATFGWNNAAAISHIGGCSFGRWNMAVEVQAPYLASGTFFNAPFMDGSNAGTTTAVHNVASSYTDFTLTPSTGTLTGGIIYVYGYQKA